jgi:hypothetical protein
MVAYLASETLSLEKIKMINDVKNINHVGFDSGDYEEYYLIEYGAV